MPQVAQVGMTFMKVISVFVFTRNFDENRHIYTYDMIYTHMKYAQYIIDK